MELPSGRYNFLLFIAIIQILYGSMDTSVDCVPIGQLHCPGGLPDLILPLCRSHNSTGEYVISPDGFPTIVEGPCPGGTRADEHGNCRQHLD